MFKCFLCNRTFDSPIAVEESRGEFWGIPCSETMYYSPCCNDSAFGYIVDTDVYGTEICDGEEYYELDNVKVAKENLREYLSEKRCIA